MREAFKRILVLVVMLTAVCAVCSAAEYSIRNAGFTLDGATAVRVASGALAFDCDITNSNQTENKVTMIMTFYNGNKMQSICSNTKNIAAGATEHFRTVMNISHTQSNSYVEVLVWESIKSGKPILKDSYKLTTKNNAKIIKTAVLPTGEVGVIDETKGEIVFTLSSVTNMAELMPVLTISDDATVSPASGEKVNLSAPVTYTVTAEDGTSRQYTARVRRIFVNENFENSIINGSWTINTGSPAGTGGTVGIVADPNNPLNSVWKVVDSSTQSTNNRVVATLPFAPSGASASSFVLRYRIMYDRNDPGVSSGTTTIGGENNNVSYSGVDIMKDPNSESSSSIAVSIAAKEPSSGTVQLITKGTGGSTEKVISSIVLKKWYDVKLVYRVTTVNGVQTASIKYYVDGVECTDVENTNVSIQNMIKAVRIVTSTYRKAIIYIDDINITEE